MKENNGQVGENLEYDNRYVFLVDNLEGEDADSALSDSGSDNTDSIEFTKKTKKYLIELLDETVDYRLYIHAIVHAIKFGSFADLIEATKNYSESSLQYWDDCYPLIEEDGLEIRAGLNQFLNKNLSLISSKPVLIEGRGESWSLEGWLECQNGNEKYLFISEFVTGPAASDAQVIHGDLQSTISSLSKLENFLTNDKNIYDISISPLREKLEKVNDALISAFSLSPSNVDKNEAIEVPISPTNEGGDGSLSNAVQSEPSQTIASAPPTKLNLNNLDITNKTDAILVMRKASEYFKKYEPSSPVSGLLDRSVRLASKDFVAVLEELAPESVEKVKLLLGIGKEAEKSEDAS